LIARLQGMTAPAMRIAPTPIIRRLAWPLLAATILLAAGASFLALRSSRDKAALATANTHHAEVLAQAAERETRLAQDLARANEALAAARLTLARLESPTDPATLAQSRRKLLEVPGTLRVAWKPFDLPDAPAEQRSVAGDVAWNDELKQGY